MELKKKTLVFISLFFSLIFSKIVFGSEFIEGKPFSIGREKGLNMNLIIPLELNIQSKRGDSAYLTQSFAMDFAVENNLQLSGRIVNQLLSKLESSGIEMHQIWDNKRTLIQMLDHLEIYEIPAWCHLSEIKDVFSSFERIGKIQKLGTLNKEVLLAKEYLQNQVLKLLDTCDESAKKAFHDTKKVKHYLKKIAHQLAILIREEADRIHSSNFQIVLHPPGWEVTLNSQYTENGTITTVQPRKKRVDDYNALYVNGEELGEGEEEYQDMKNPHSVRFFEHGLEVTQLEEKRLPRVSRLSFGARGKAKSKGKSGYKSFESDPLLDDESL